MASLRLEIEGANRGVRTIRIESCLSQMDNLLKMTHDPIDFMCQALGVNPICKNQLDEVLAKQFVQNMPKNGFNLLFGSSQINSNQFDADCEFPTLLHFSACHGLTKLTAILLDCTGSKEAIQMRNVSEMTPAELANVNGHFDLANKLHSLHIGLSKSSTYEGSLSNYQIPPPPRPVHVKTDPFGTMRAEKKVSPTPALNIEDEELEDDVFMPDKFGTLKANKAIFRGDYRQEQKVNNTDELAITDEFLKLLEDFQNKNFSAKEREMLFQNWKRKAELQDLKVKLDVGFDISEIYLFLSLFRSKTSPKMKISLRSKKLRI